MAGLLIFILSRHGENSLWRLVTQIASEACWFWNQGCVGGRTMASPLRKFSLLVLSLWAGDPGQSTQEKPFSLQPLSSNAMCWQGPGRDLIRAEWIGRAISRLIRSRSPCLALFFESTPTQETRITTRIPFPPDKGLSRAFSHPFFLILPWVWSDVERDRGSVLGITQGWTFLQSRSWAWGEEGGWQSRVRVGVGGRGAKWWILFPFIALNLTSKLFHSFYLERSPHLKKHRKSLLCLRDNFM